MRLIYAVAFALCVLTVAPVGCFAGDPKSDVSAAYAAFDAAFNKGDAKAVAALYLLNAKVLPPTHEVASGPAAIEKFFAGLHGNGVTDHKLEVIDAGGEPDVLRPPCETTNQAGLSAKYVKFQRIGCLPF